MYGHPPRGIALAGHLAYFALTICAFSISDEKFQKAFVVLAILIDAGYIVSLLLTLV